MTLIFKKKKNSFYNKLYFIKVTLFALLLIIDFLFRFCHRDNI